MATFVLFGQAVAQDGANARVTELRTRIAKLADFEIAHVLSWVDSRL
jgi:hypothetical protein